MATLEHRILVSTRAALNNYDLRLEDIRDWSIFDIKHQDGQIVIAIGDPHVHIAVKREMDKRVKE